MPRHDPTRQPQNPTAYRDDLEGLSAVSCDGRDAGAERRSIIRAANAARQAAERAKEAAARAAALEGTEAAVIARQRAAEERGNS